MDSITSLALRFVFLILVVAIALKLRGGGQPPPSWFPEKGRVGRWKHLFRFADASFTFILTTAFLYLLSKDVDDSILTATAIVSAWIVLTYMAKDNNSSSAS